MCLLFGASPTDPLLGPPQNITFGVSRGRNTILESFEISTTTTPLCPQRCCGATMQGPDRVGKVLLHTSQQGAPRSLDGILRPSAHPKV